MITQKNRAHLKTRNARFFLSQVVDLSLARGANVKRPARAPKVRLSIQAQRHARRFQSLSKAQRRIVTQIVALLAKARLNL